MGFGVLAAIPDTGLVYPLLGRPHDSLNLRKDDRYDLRLFPKSECVADVTDQLYCVLL